MTQILFDHLLRYHPENQGYYCQETDEVYIDITLPFEKMRETLIHELLESELCSVCKHDLIERLTEKISYGMGLVEKFR